MTLDDAIPRWQFRERHSIRIAATPDRIFDAIRDVTAGEIRFFHLLTTIRRFGRPAPASILNAPPDEPILHLATRTGFRYLGVHPPREIVIGLDPAPQVFAAMNFRLDGDRLSTETRVATRGVKATIFFGAYWMVIRAGSGLIRRTWLRAIKKRAERI